MKIEQVWRSGWDEYTKQAVDGIEMMFDLNGRTWFARFTLDGKIVRVDEGYPQSGRTLQVMRDDWVQAIVKKFGPQFEKALRPEQLLKPTA